MGIKVTGKRIMIAAMLAAWPAAAQANIGDTMQELRGHYGSAKDMGGQMLFEVRLVGGRLVPARESANTPDHFAIAVYFDGTRSAMEVFTRNTTDPAKSEMTDDDINAILNAASDGTPWMERRAQDGKRTWILGQPPKLLARFDPNKNGSADSASVLYIMLYTKK